MRGLTHEREGGTTILSGPTIEESFICEHTNPSAFLFGDLALAGYRHLDTWLHSQGFSKDYSRSEGGAHSMETLMFVSVGISIVPK